MQTSSPLMENFLLVDALTATASDLDRRAQGMPVRHQIGVRCSSVSAAGGGGENRIGD